MAIAQDSWLGKLMRAHANGTNVFDKVVSAPIKISDALNGGPPPKPKPAPKRQITEWPGATPKR